MKNKDQPQKRTWFQSHQERLDEKEKFKLVQKEKGPKSKRNKEDGKTKQSGLPKTKKKGGAKKSEVSSDRSNQELDKVMLMQARLAKKMSKPKTMHSTNDAEEAPRSKK